jgi:hypothetical protein
MSAIDREAHENNAVVIQITLKNEEVFSKSTVLLKMFFPL